MTEDNSRSEISVMAEASNPAESSEEPAAVEDVPPIPDDLYSPPEWAAVPKKGKTTVGSPIIARLCYRAPSALTVPTMAQATT